MFDTKVGCHRQYGRDLIHCAGSAPRPLGQSLDHIGITVFANEFKLSRISARLECTRWTLSFYSLALVFFAHSPLLCSSLLPDISESRTNVQSKANGVL